jgi:hypothetical protein
VSSREVAEGLVLEIPERPAAEQDMGDCLSSLAALATGVADAWHSSSEEKVA